MRWPERGVEVWGVNYPGFGGSTGPARLARIGPTALAAFDELKRTAGARPIIVSGTSFGTIAALHVAAQRDAAGVVLHNPPALREMIVKGHGWWNLWLVAGPLSRKVPAALDSVANARAANERAVFLLAEKDEIVAPRFQELVVNAYAAEKRLIKLRGAGHLTPLDPESLVVFAPALIGWWRIRCTRRYTPARRPLRAAATDVERRRATRFRSLPPARARGPRAALRHSDSPRRGARRTRPSGEHMYAAPQCGLVRRSGRFARAGSY